MSRIVIGITILRFVKKERKTELCNKEKTLDLADKAKKLRLAGKKT